jgi:hypothetical protein
MCMVLRGMHEIPTAESTSELRISIWFRVTGTVASFSKDRQRQLYTFRSHALALL